MSAIYAELHVAGHVFVLRRCTYGVRQATGPRGRPIEQVRHLAIDGEMDVPRDQFLEKWAATEFMPVDGHIMFSGGPGEPAIETVSWTAGQCVLYREVFTKGSITDGSYICQWRIVAAKLVFSAGGPPAPFVAAAAREHGQPLPVIPSAAGIGPAGWADSKKLPAWTEEHKQTRWAEYQRDKAGNSAAYNQARWDASYESARNNNVLGLGREREYAQAMGATSKVLKTPFTNRQIDMYVEEKDYCGQLKTGKVYLTDQAKIDLEKDEYLINVGYEVEYILEKGGSKPLLAELHKIGATVKLGPQIP